MKVAVISTVPTCGKTTFIEILGSVYSRSQGRDVAVFTTGDARDNFEQVTNYAANVALDNPHTFRAQVQNAGLDAKELLHYGLQAGDEHVFMYDIMGSSMARNEKEDFFMEAIEAVPVDLTLIEIHGSIKDEFNARVISNCDCSLILTEQSMRGLRKLSKLLEEAELPAIKRNRAIVISKADPIVVSDKKMASQLKTTVQSLYKFPRSSMVAKYAYDGVLDKVAYNVISGDYEFVQYRVPMLEIMQFLFDAPNRKIIRGIDRWYR